MISSLSSISLIIDHALTCVKSSSNTAVFGVCRFRLLSKGKTMHFLNLKEYDSIAEPAHNSIIRGCLISLATLTGGSCGIVSQEVQPTAL